jgi:hypothetical protein
MLSESADLCTKYDGPISKTINNKFAISNRSRGAYSVPPQSAFCRNRQQNSHRFQTAAAEHSIAVLVAKVTPLLGYSSVFPLVGTMPLITGVSSIRMFPPSLYGG